MQTDGFLRFMLLFFKYCLFTAEPGDILLLDQFKVQLVIHLINFLCTFSFVRSGESIGDEELQASPWPPRV